MKPPGNCIDTDAARRAAHVCDQRLCADLLERVKSAPHGSVSLDLDIMEAVWPTWREDAGDDRLYFITSSTDAALSLVDRVLPGWRGGVNKRGDGLWFGEIFGKPISKKLYEIHSKTAPSPALALIATLLSAMASGDHIPRASEAVPHRSQCSSREAPSSLPKLSPQEEGND